MGTLKNIFGFEKSKLGNMWGKVKDNPEQLLLGAGDPFHAKMWGGITGKEYSPLVDQWGGATKDDYAKAEAEGIDTRDGRAMHGIAKAIAAIYAGKWANGRFGVGGGGTAGAGGGEGSLSGGLFNFSGTQAAAPITEATVIPASGGAGASASAAPAADWTSLLGQGGLGNNQGRQRPSSTEQPVHWQAPYNPMNDPAVQSLQAQQQRRAVADALLAQAQGAGYTKIGAF